jgi:hypothetical protein
MALVERRTAVESRNCPARPKPSISEPVVTIKVWHDHLGTDLQFDFRRDPKDWQRVRDALAAVKEKIERDFEHEAQCPARPKATCSLGRSCTCRPKRPGCFNYEAPNTTGAPCGR